LQLARLLKAGLLRASEYARFQQFGLQSDQAKSFRWRQDTVVVPSRALSEPGTACALRDALAGIQEKSFLVQKSLMDARTAKADPKRARERARERLAQVLWSYETRAKGSFLASLQALTQEEGATQAFQDRVGEECRALVQDTLSLASPPIRLCDRWRHRGRIGLHDSAI
jgi:hypothetical protein